jgi:hypothetical protein
MSVFSICMAKAALAAALASGATYAGVALTTPAPAPAVAAYVCPTTGAGGNPIKPGECAYLTDLHNAGITPLSTTLSAASLFCYYIKTQGQATAADNLYKAWQNNPAAITEGQAQQYASFAWSDVCPEYGY